MLWEKSLPGRNHISAVADLVTFIDPEDSGKCLADFATFRVQVDAHINENKSEYDFEEDGSLKPVELE